MHKQSQLYSTFNYPMEMASQQNNKYYNTFYEPSNLQNLQQTHDIITSSKRLIQQIQDKKFKNFVKSNKKIKNDEAKRNQGSFKNINIKDKIEASLRNIKLNGTIADQLLFQNKNNIQNQDIENRNKNEEYLNVIQDVYSHKNKRKGKKKIKQPSSSSQSNKNIKKLSRKELQMNLKNQIMRNVNIKNSHHYISPQDNQTTISNKGQANKLQQQLFQQLQNLDSHLLKNRAHHQKLQSFQSNNNGNKASKFSQFNTREKYNNDSNRDRVSIKLKQNSNSNIEQQRKIGRKSNNFTVNQQKYKQLIDLQLSSSEQGQQHYRINVKQAQNNQYIKKISEQIKKDINNVIIQRKQSIHSQYKLKNDDNPMNCQNQQQYCNHKINSKKNIKNQSLHKKTTFGEQNQLKRTQDLYSFRQQLENQNEIFDIPKELIYQNSSNKNLPYHTDYGTGLSQDKIRQMLSCIANRVKYSPAVIDVVMYQHESQCNNQMQIDSRYEKQQKDRNELLKKITNYVSTRNIVKNNEKNELTQKQKLMRYRFGKKVLLNNQIWRSPGKNITNKPKFISLNSPILSGQNCCKDQKIKYTNMQWKKLLKNRSADNLANLTQIIIRNNKNRLARKQNKNYSDEQDQLIKFTCNQKQLQGNCIMKQRDWQVVRQLRQKVENDY